MSYARHAKFSSPAPNSKLCNCLFQGIINSKSSNVLPTSYLKAKFDIGQGTGKKLDPDVVAKDMRRAWGPKWWEAVSRNGISIRSASFILLLSFGSESESARGTGDKARCARGKAKGPKGGLLQVLCETLELQAPSTEECTLHFSSSRMSRLL